ncbi:hypothetical protein NE237_016175 [Protea cynaroides]|uniref:Uncharacterized protein n=1 Tax=Protea cynaroides TaxID=273540 RepID=A0A9Q0KFR1_9MAGN|nr:hypothetical protein NE237_016175 [Protea cynaroides]
MAPSIAQGDLMDRSIQQGYCSGWTRLGVMCRASKGSDPLLYVGVGAGLAVPMYYGDEHALGASGVVAVRTAVFGFGRMREGPPTGVAKEIVSFEREIEDASDVQCFFARKTAIGHTTLDAATLTFASIVAFGLAIRQAALDAMTVLISLNRCRYQ